MHDITLYEQTREDPRTGFRETIWSHDRFVQGWRRTGRTEPKDTTTPAPWRVQRMPPGGVLPPDRWQEIPRADAPTAEAAAVAHLRALATAAMEYPVAVSVARPGTASHANGAPAVCDTFTFDKA